MGVKKPVKPTKAAVNTWVGINDSPQAAKLRKEKAATTRVRNLDMGIYGKGQGLPRGKGQVGKPRAGRKI
jgi:hypothetical protein